MFPSCSSSFSLSQLFGSENSINEWSGCQFRQDRKSRTELIISLRQRERALQYQLYSLPHSIEYHDYRVEFLQEIESIRIDLKAIKSSSFSHHPKDVGRVIGLTSSSQCKKTQ